MPVSGFRRGTPERSACDTGIDMVHIPYTGGGPALVALLGGQVSILFVSIPGGLKKEFATWSKVIKAAGIRFD